MAAWKEVSLDSLAAAKELLASGRWRSSVSRAYYAVYARICEELQGLATFPEGRSGPSHDDLPDMAFDYVRMLEMPDRNRLWRTIRHLYEHRIEADYGPGRTVNERLARECVMAADQVFKMLEAMHG